MSEPKTSPSLILGKQYNFNMCSTKQCVVDQVMEHHIIFHDKYVLYVGEYKCTYLNEEDEELGGKKDVPRHHEWIHHIGREKMCGVELYKNFDENLWGVRIDSTGARDHILYFHTKEKAQKFNDLFIEYIFGK